MSSERIKELMGIKSPTPGGRSAIIATNMSVARFASAIIAVLEAFFFIASVSGQGVALVDETTRMAYNISYAAMVVIALALFVVSTGYCNGRYRRLALSRIILYIFMVACAAFGIFISALDLIQGEQILVFFVMMIVCICLFIVPPIVSLPFSIIAFGVFAVVAYALGGVFTDAMKVNYSSGFVTLAIVAFLRYRAALDMVKSSEAVKNAAMHDVDTGLPNRVAFMEDRQRFVGSPVALALCDMDDFKYFNSAYGPVASDAAISAFTQHAANCFGVQNCYRYDSDEFLVVMHAPKTEVVEKLETCRRRLYEFSYDDARLYPGYSAGYAYGEPRNIEELSDMVALAEQCLVKAKRMGKNRTVGADYFAGVASEDVAAQMLLVKYDELDALTNLPTLSRFRTSAQRRCHENAQAGTRAAFVYFDIENIEAYSREYGIESKDALIVELAELLREEFPRAVIGRLSESTFALLTNDKDYLDKTNSVHERAHLFQRGVVIEFNAGIYCLKPDEVEIGSALDCAHMACELVRGCYDVNYRIFDEELRREVELRQYVINNIDRAIQEDWLEVWYQPVVRVQTGSVCGLEALIRWNDPVHGMLSPAAFVDTLEQNHLVHKVDSFVIERVGRDYADCIREGGAPVPVSTNLSRLDFELFDVFGTVERVLRENSMPPDMLHVEIVESAFSGDIDLMRVIIERFHNLGVEVWIDDFGSGYSSLNQLKDYDFDTVKIDMVFLSEFENSSDARLIVASVVSMCNQLGMQTLVEGVETADQLEFLKRIGCDRGQGYYISKPRSLDSLRAFLAQKSVEQEDPSEADYYDKVGRVNLLGGQVVSDESLSNEPAHADDAMPIAVLELHEGRFRYLSYNNSYLRLLNSIGIDGPEGGERLFNGNGLHLQAEFREVCRLCRETGEEACFEHENNGKALHTHVRFIAESHSGSSAYLLTTVDVGMLMGAREQGSRDVIKQNLLMLYERLDVVDARGAFVENLYASPSLAAYPGFKPVGITFMDYAQAYVHESDQQEFVEFCNPHTFEARLAQSPAGYLVGFFRAIRQEGGWGWQMYMLVPIVHKGESAMLFVTRRVNENNFSKNPNSGELLSANMLWNALMNLENVGFYWKDDKGRYLGANRSFLDYMDCADISDIAGKTDEELMWHPNPHPRKVDDERILSQGTTSSDFRDTCISHAGMREIVENKAAVFDGAGNVAGLVGFLKDKGTSTDASTRAREKGDLARVFTDSDKHGIGLFISGVLEYQDAYEREGLDFEFMYLSIADLFEYDKKYAYGFSSRVLYEIRRILERNVGTRAVYSHVSANIFMIAGRSSGEGESLEVEVRRLLADIVEVDGIRCSVRIATGSALYSECLSIDGVMRLADDRLRASRNALG